MDENYLDTLLGEVSGNGQSNNSFDDSVELDAGIDIDLNDIGDISLSEMDDLGELGDLDLDSLDLDDIDFDDLDMMNLDSEKAKKDILSNDDDFDFDSLLEDTADDNADFSNDGADFFDDMEEMPENVDTMSNAQTDMFANQPQEEVSVDDFIDSIGLDDGNISTDDVFNEAEAQYMQDENDDQMMNPEDLFGDAAAASSGEDDANMDLDALFSALGIEDEEDGSGDEDNYTSGQDNLDDLFASAAMSADLDMEGLEDIEDISEAENVKAAGKKKKTKNKKAKGEKSEKGAKPAKGEKASKEGKKSISEVLFGEPDEDDLEEEQLLEAKKAEKEEKKAKKQQEKEEKSKQKEALQASKQKVANDKQKAKNEKKAAKEAELQAELEEEQNAKKVPTVIVIIVFAIFAALAGTVVVGTKTFDYTIVIKKATDYFERQRYRLAYDEIAGVDVKKKDEDLKNRIYTVMYVERLYESYENNVKLERYDRALDALLRGIEKYDEHYDEAVELGIVADIDSCKAKIVVALQDRYGLSEEAAYEIIALEGQEYSQRLVKVCENIGVGQ